MPEMHLPKVVFVLQLASYILMDDVKLTHAPELCLADKGDNCVTYIEQTFPDCVSSWTWPCRKKCDWLWLDCLVLFFMLSLNKI